MKSVNDFRLRFGKRELVPIVVGGMGVDISTADLALEAARLGGVGHISDAMVQGKPRPEAVMPKLRAFLGDHVCVAHNASFDRRFFTAEMELAGEQHDRHFLCSMLLSRRLWTARACAVLKT